MGNITERRFDLVWRSTLATVLLLAAAGCKDPVADVAPTTTDANRNETIAESDLPSEDSSAVVESSETKAPTESESASTESPASVPSEPSTPDPESNPPAKETSDQVVEATDPATEDAEPKPIIEKKPEDNQAVAVPALPPETIYEPVVAMSQQHLDTCLVGIGDTMPDLKLTDAEGEPHSLSSVFGDRLTVVVFWQHASLFAREQAARLEKEVVQPFASNGVAVIAVNVGDAAEKAAETVSSETGVISLLDEDGMAFAAVAKEKVPRTYILDKDGKVLWFDLEYSQSMRRELRNALHFYLQG